MTWRVAIPSYQRAATLAKCTLPTLVDGGVDPDLIDIWVADKEQRAEYLDVLVPGTYGGVMVAAPTLRGARNHIARAYPAGTRLLCADDDVRALKAKADKKLVPITDVAAVVDRGFREMDKAGARIWGIYPASNAMFMKDAVRTGLTYIIGSFWGVHLRGDPCELVTLEDKEDVERSCRFFERDGTVCRLEDVTVISNYYTEPGGMQVTRTPGRVASSARRMVEMFPRLATYWERKDGTAEVRLREKR
jgi:hypothetical protein